MTHDPLCRCHGEESPIPFCQSHAWCRCECDFIYLVRADQDRRHAARELTRDAQDMGLIP